MKCKMFLLKIMQETLEPIRERRAMWEQRLPEVREILRRGTEEACRVGEQTMSAVRQAMRIVLQ
jgi:tryptophanyl-tRNA synthetase